MSELLNLVSEQEVREINIRLEIAIKEAEAKRDRSCYCDLNVQDHRGACHLCNYYARLKYLIEEGQKVINMQGWEFQAIASDFVERSKSILTKLNTSPGRL